MERVSLDDAEPDRLADGVARHALSGPLGADGVAVNRYRLAPGAELPGGLHAHTDQEEVFVVLEGEATFEVLAPAGDGGAGTGDGDAGTGDAVNREARTVTVAAGEAVRFAPGEFQSGRNGTAGDGDSDDDRDAAGDGDAAGDDLVVLALGAPRDSEDVRIPVACPACGRGAVRLDAGAGGVEFVCPDCAARRTPLPCPDCGGDDLRVVPGEGTGTAVACRGCGAAFEEPPTTG